MFKPSKILVPTDFSEPSNRALRQALDIAKQYRAKVFLLHVMHGEFYGSWDFLALVLGEELLLQMTDRHLTKTKERLQNQLDNFPEAKEVEVVTDIRRGIPYEVILDEGKEKRIDLIVIASLGRTGIAKYLIGGVARNVLKGSKCPVLLTK
jgi:universal stress protein A